MRRDRATEEEEERGARFCDTGHGHVFHEHGSVRMMASPAL